MAWPAKRPPGAGRKKGVCNYRSLKVAELLKDRKFDLVVHILDKINTLDDREQIQVCLALMPYVYPKRGIVETDNPEEPQKQVVDLQKTDTQERIATINYLREALRIPAGETHGNSTSTRSEAAPTKPSGKS